MLKTDLLRKYNKDDLEYYYKKINLDIESCAVLGPLLDLLRLSTDETDSIIINHTNNVVSLMYHKRKKAFSVLYYYLRNFENKEKLLTDFGFFNSNIRDLTITYTFRKEDFEGEKARICVKTRCGGFDLTSFLASGKSAENAEFIVLNGTLNVQLLSIFKIRSLDNFDLNSSIEEIIYKILTFSRISYKNDFLAYLKYSNQLSEFYNKVDYYKLYQDRSLLIKNVHINMMDFSIRIDKIIVYIDFALLRSELYRLHDLNVKTATIDCIKADLANLKRNILA